MLIRGIIGPTHVLAQNSKTVRADVLFVIYLLVLFAPDGVHVSNEYPFMDTHYSPLCVRDHLFVRLDYLVKIFNERNGYKLARVAVV